MRSFHGESLEITLTVPLSNILYVWCCFKVTNFTSCLNFHVTVKLAFVHCTTAVNCIFVQFYWPHCMFLLYICTVLLYSSNSTLFYNVLNIVFCWIIGLPTKNETTKTTLNSINIKNLLLNVPLKGVFAKIKGVRQNPNQILFCLKGQNGWKRWIPNGLCRSLTNLN